MELKEFLSILKKNCLSIMAITALFLVVAIVVTLLIPPSYRSSIDVYVSRKAASESDDFYTYDGYYSTQSSIQYTNTVSGLFRSLQIIREASKDVDANILYEKDSNEPEDMANDVEYLRKISKRITVEDVAPRIINVSYQNDSEIKSKIWVMSIGSVVQDKVAEINAETDGNFKVDISTEPLTEEITPSLVINIIVSLMSGLLLGILYSFGKIYFKKGK
jgi:capsular polysaccharide biosynthesis protein